MMTSEARSRVRTEHSFRDAAVAFAVDVSGSTSGRTLAAEKQFVHQVALLLAPRSQIEAAIIPWDNEVKAVRTLSKLQTLKADGWTSPAAIIRHTQARLALKTSSVWFLCTDGLIPDQDRVDFANELAAQKVHGLTCVTVIFGKTVQIVPGACNVSVGVSVYAAVPDCLFLYCDVHTGETYIFSAKGIFKSLLGSETCPIINDATTWSDLPRLQLEELASLTLPAVKDLSQDELALQGDMVVKLEDLWSNKLSGEDVSKILSDDENLSSIVMTAQSRNQTDRFQTWIQQQEIKVNDPLDEPRHDLNSKARSTYLEVLGILKVGGKPHTILQQRLRSAYAANMAYFVREHDSQRHRAKQRSTVIDSASRQSMTPIASPIAFTPTSAYSAQSAPTRMYQPDTVPDQFRFHRQQSSYAHPQPSYEDLIYKPSISSTLTQSYAMPPPPIPHATTPSYVPHYRTPGQTVSAPEPPQAPRKAVHQKHHELLYTPGFKRARGSFLGACSICGASSETMAWIFHAESPNMKTPGFPKLMESSTPLYPLAAGNFPETDVLSVDICCESCSWFSVQTKMSPSDGQIIGALPMVHYSENETAIKKALFKVLGGRFDPEYVTQVFLSILLSNVDEQLDESDQEQRIFQQMIQWASRDIVYNSTCLPELSLAFSQPLHSSRLQPLSEVLKASFDSINELTSCVMRYPLDGFITVVRAAVIAGVDVKLRRRAVFRRLLYLMTEAFMSKDIRKDALKTMLQTTASQTSPDSMIIDPPSEPLTSLQSISNVPIVALRGSLILDERVYRKLDCLLDFKQLTSGDCTWAGPAIAAFLHVLAALHGNVQTSEPWDLFNAIMNQYRLGGISVRPEDFSIQEAKQVIQAFV